MSHWLEEAEQENQRDNEKRRSAEYLDRMHRIATNYQQHKEEYDAFAKKMHELISRVNALPLEKRQPFGNIDAIFKDSKLNNKRYVFTSFRRFQKKVFRGSIMDLFRPHSMKQLRRLTMTVSSKQDMVGFDVRDETLLKERIIVDEHLVEEKDPYRDPDRYHKYHNYKINDLNQELALEIIDWLAFKKEVKDLRFVKE